MSSNGFPTYGRGDQPEEPREDEHYAKPAPYGGDTFGGSPYVDPSQPGHGQPGPDQPGSYSAAPQPDAYPGAPGAYPGAPAPTRSSRPIPRSPRPTARCTRPVRRRAARVQPAADLPPRPSIRSTSAPAATRAPDVRPGSGGTAGPASCPSRPAGRAHRGGLRTPGHLRPEGVPPRDLPSPRLAPEPPTPH